MHGGSAGQSIRTIMQPLISNNAGLWVLIIGCIRIESCNQKLIDQRHPIIRVSGGLLWGKVGSRWFPNQEDFSIGSGAK